MSNPSTTNESDLPACDNWHGVVDPKKRKQIQDRLAQRARRQRLASAKDGSKSKRAMKSRQALPRKSIEERTGQETCRLEAVAIVPRPGARAPDPVEAAPVGIKCISFPSRPQEYTFLSALFDNGALLGIACGSNFPSKSKPTGPAVPLSLHPTILQLSTVHWQWIDRLPFADARDEIIIQSGSMDEEDFLRDIFSMNTFKMQPGAKPWDPSAFTMYPEFRQKWGFLFPSFHCTITGIA